MALKPSKRQAVLVQERVRECIHDPSLSTEERSLMEAFDADLEQYLR